MSSLYPYHEEFPLAILVVGDESRQGKTNVAEEEVRCFLSTERWVFVMLAENLDITKTVSKVKVVFWGFIVVVRNSGVQ